MEDFICTDDGSITDSGSPEQRPPSLQFALDLCLSSPLPTAVAWGNAFTFFHNAAWRVTLGQPLTPQALERSAWEVYPELWSVIGAAIEQVFTQKQAITLNHCRLSIDRHPSSEPSALEEIYFTCAATPLFEQTGEQAVGAGSRESGGVFITVTETTPIVLQKRRSQTLQHLVEAIDRFSQSASTLSVCQMVVSILSASADISFVAIYSSPPDGEQANLCAECSCHSPASVTNFLPKQINLAATEPDSLAAKMLTGRTFVWDNLAWDNLAWKSLVKENRGCDPVSQPSINLDVSLWKQALGLPLTDKRSHQIGWLMLGLNPGFPLDRDYQTFLETIGRHVSSALASTFASEMTRQLSQGESDLIITDALPVLVAFIDSEQRYRFNNRRYEEWFGRPTTTLYGRTLEEVLGTAAYQIVQPYVERALAGEKVSFESEAPYQAGGTRYINATYIPRFTIQGQVEGFVALINDITERRRAEVEYARLLEREQQHTHRLQQLAEAAVAIHSALALNERLQLITDQARSIIQAHQCFTSTTIDETGAQSIHAISLSDKYAQWQKQNELKETGVYNITCQTQWPMRLTQAELEGHPDWRTSSWAATYYPPMRGWLAAPLISQGGKNIGLIQLSDKYEGEFTEEDEAILVQLAQMAASAIDHAHLYEASQQANRIKDEFLAILSHELRSPLNAILGWSKLLRAQEFDQPTTFRALETIERNAQLQTQLIEDLLDVSRILRGKISLQFTPVNIKEPIAAAIETMRLAAEAKAIEIVPLLQDQIGLVAGDSSRLQQVFWNLLSNSIKFTPNGGRVEIKLEQSNTHIQIQVSDTGRGITAEFLPYIFDHFRQADASTTRAQGGLGLGLAIVRHLIELHGGTIQAKSSGEGKGATFMIELPLSYPSLQAYQKAMIPKTSINLQGIKILVVDDDEDARDFAVFVLGQYGAEVVSASCAKEALKVFEQNKPDILVTDLGMPEVDGYSLLQSVRAIDRKSHHYTPAIAVTAYASEENRKQALTAGFERHIAKPVNPNDLAKYIFQLLKSP